MSAGRPPRIRKDYLADAQALLQLSRAVDLDARRPEAWRASICAQLIDMANALLRAPENS